MSKTRCILCVTIFLFLGFFPWSSFQTPSEFSTITSLDQKLYDSSEEIYDTIDSVFTSKNEDYSTYGFYPQLYEPSLQATYYGLYVLDVVGKLEQINETQIINYIMSTYNTDAHIFMDAYSYRYLDYDFTNWVLYPLTSLLQIHCYAILSLELLNSLALIDVEESKDFIWSCYNNFTSGFIGQPYHSSLEYYAQIATADNTYFAVQALDMIIGNWAGHTQERDDLISYINSLQISNSLNWDFGGFTNDNESFFFPLRLYADATMFSSYYCIKTLELFGMEGTINYENFYLFLEELYNPDDNSFQYMEGSEQSYANIVATALALDLSTITGFASYNESGTVEFVFNNRNTLGIWKGSTEIQYHELLDTFQVIRVLNDVGLLSQLSFGDTTQITDTLLDYFLTPTSFSLISKDYTTINLLHTIISSYELYDKLPELDFQDLYQTIKSAYYQDYRYIHGFCSIVEPEHYNDGTFARFRSYPIEFFSRGNKHHLPRIDYFFSHKYSFYALDSLQKLFKLDDFSLTSNLHNLVDDILSTQFLNNSYPDFYGAFSYMTPYGELHPQFLIDDIFFEYTYFAIKTLELLAEHLNIGDVTFLPIDIPALQSYITTHMVETSEQLYFTPHYTDNVETILQNTYYMAYVLKALDIFDLDIEKLGTFIDNTLNYSNIQNIYYSFMLSKLVEYDIEFDSGLVQDLLESIFFEPNHEFFLTSNRNTLNQEIFLWICEMVKGDSLRIEAQYPQKSVLGGDITITASLFNTILTYFGSNLSFTLESDQLGIHIFEQISSNNYSLTLSIAHSSANYPTINAKIVTYTSNIKLAEINIQIITFYPKGEYEEIFNGTLVLSVLFITIPGGIIIFSEKKLRKEKPKI